MLCKIHWKFITPLSPHQGEMYESLIKVTKRALRMSTGEQILSWNEMATVFAEVKSILNSRPLTYMSDDPNDLRPLTPNQLLLGRRYEEHPQAFSICTHYRDQFLEMIYRRVCSEDDSNRQIKMAEKKLRNQERRPGTNRWKQCPRRKMEPWTGNGSFCRKRRRSKKRAVKDQE